MQQRAMTVATLLEPLLIVAMGGVVMLIVPAVLLPGAGSTLAACRKRALTLPG